MVLLVQLYHLKYINGTIIYLLEFIMVVNTYFHWDEKISIDGYTWSWILL
jgi:hypothetical protein